MFVICSDCDTETGREEEPWIQTDHQPSATAGAHCQTNHSGGQGETPHVFIYLGPFNRRLHSNCIQMFQKNSVFCVLGEWSQRAEALQRPSETRCNALNPLEGRNEDSAMPLGHSSKWSKLGNGANGKHLSAG